MNIKVPDQILLSDINKHCRHCKNYEKNTKTWNVYEKKFIIIIIIIIFIIITLDFFKILKTMINIKIIPSECGSYNITLACIRHEHYIYRLREVMFPVLHGEGTMWPLPLMPLVSQSPPGPVQTCSLCDANPIEKMVKSGCNY